MQALAQIAGMRLAWGLIAGLTVLRVAGLLLSPVNLHGDEAQYWSWSQSLELGYFSKPPLIAWTIALTTGLFGEAEWAIRLASPLAHAAGAAFLLAFARRRWGVEAAFWSGIVYLTLPAIWLSSGVISTDALLLPIWAGALWALDRYLERQSLARALTLGAFIGLGFLAKYAILFFLAGLAALALLNGAARKALLKPVGSAAVAVALVGIAPNLIWNAQHDFATVSHTAANARWEAANLHFDELGQFLLDQMAVFGPITFVLLVWALIAVARRTSGLGADGLFLAAFIAPPLLVVMFQAFISRAHANWAASAYIAGTLLVVTWALQSGRRAWLAAAVGLHVVVGGVFATAAIAPAFADSVGLANAFKRARGWPETTAEVREVYERGDSGQPYTAVMVDNRLLFHGIEYYARDEPLPLRMWLRFGGPVSHAESIAPITTADAAPGGQPVLVVSEREHDRDKIAADFASIEVVGSTEIDLGGGKTRPLVFYAARGFAPLDRGPEYEAMWEDASSDAAD
ncbi:MAG: glycosyltransferase family 39 protein [Maricaulaceae bacterium]|jgi:4-amino-4-deoxy-L-arabinose transferase-like glycosyltransferase